MTVQEILTAASEIYKSSVTDANKVIALNRFHKNVFMELTRLKNDFTFDDQDTVASQLTYDLPEDCKLKNIIKVEVSEVATDDITDTTEWTEY
jgi:hypothetical protein